MAGVTCLNHPAYSPESMNAEVATVTGTHSAYRWSPNDPAWIAEIDDELFADYDQLKRDLDLEARAHEDGRQNRPGSDDAEFNDTQLSIQSLALEKIGALYAF